MNFSMYLFVIDAVSSENIISTTVMLSICSNICGGFLARKENTTTATAIPFGIVSARYVISFFVYSFVVSFIAISLLMISTVYSVIAFSQNVVFVHSIFGYIATPIST